ncbi:hypothetical protein EIN_096730 [Entamoeba invadens IP1]|uniref:Uncharacterized protein n=1 Tax=Entamoeba invadens IP1 TaxID=370355 RepID=A0A0A1U6H1_ENTIV|nr:hypothetical protein EIN_096730 [Entamoeba invadens IP1]ELP87406.1 hypothetical protein EIN_096730 [Entamoeba invadens IP1]|eukprot:XP_004254177.1 hypothetical protein EIN_096730 [Entamoeba invadens IP1]
MEKDLSGSQNEQSETEDENVQEKIEQPLQHEKQYNDAPSSQKPVEKIPHEVDLSILPEEQFATTPTVIEVDDVYSNRNPYFEATTVISLYPTVNPPRRNFYRY